MTWEKPSFVEIDMSAEIGSYQSDFGDGWDGVEGSGAPVITKASDEAPDEA